MANYEVQRTLQYNANGKDRQPLVLQKGDVVQGAYIPNMSRIDAEICRKAEKRMQGTTVRLLFFRAWGVTRYAHAVRDLKPTRKSPTVQVETIPDG